MGHLKLAEFGSPEQISGYLKVDGQPTVSHESINQRIYGDTRRWTPHRTLHCQKAHRKRQEGRERGGTIPTSS